MNPETKESPPLSFTIRWCPVCGRDSRVMNLTKRHFSGGERCVGVPVDVQYVFDGLVSS